MSLNHKLTRRRLLGQALGAAAITFSGCPSSRPATAPPARPAARPADNPSPSPNGQVGVGIIGCGRRNGQLVIGKGGQGNLPAHARIVAVADFNMARAQQWARNYRAKAYQDYRALLDRKDVDVVIYATPEHWHYLPCIRCCQAGKHVYGEQPLGHTIREGRRMIQAVRKYQRVFQTGEQQRSHPATRKGVELIRNGRIGKVQSIIGYNYPSPYECDFQAQPIPQELDWDAWCGPNEVVPYHTDLYLSRIPYEREAPYYTTPAEQYSVGPGWMSFRPYSGGELLNWGCHGLSVVHWALDMDRSGPVEVWVEPEEKLPTVVYDLPGTRDRGDAACSHPIVHYRYANGVVLSLTSIDPKVGGGATFIGEKGRITIFRDGYECHPAGLDEDPLPPDGERVYESDDHMGNFFDCVASGKDPIMPVEAGHSVAALCHLGNIARWLGRRLQWDPEKEIFPHDAEANQYLDVPKRKPYELPDDV
ncbi:MAG: Gfo/Idh/MocA family oxidoreductase [Planctomycetes bacterium]|nr:Gfo/Idh/MocA family oxidoreductase [Planctomycetota bacterium]